MLNRKQLLTTIIHRFPTLPVKHFQGGFTLTELLVTIIIGGIIVTSVTSLMVDILRSNKREEVFTQTQQDMQRALEFIENDLENAVYIYTGKQLRNDRRDEQINSVASHLDTNDDYEIVLAFWKPEQIPYTLGGPTVPLNCENSDGNKNSNLADETSIEECQTLQTERRTYTLVVYLQETDPSNTWSGQSVIRRYQLRKYDSDSTYTEGERKYLTLALQKNSDGEKIYVDPRKDADGFANWPYDNNNNDLLGEITPTVNGNTSPVLVDFVDNANNDPGNLPDCSEEGYSRTPAVDQSTSFFACVRQAEGEGDFSEGNQDVLVYLRGNPDGRSGFQLSDNSYQKLPTLKTQIMLRGVVDKFINQ